MTVNIISIFIFIIHPKLKTQHRIKRLNYSELRLTILSIFFLIPLIVFVAESVQGYSILEIVNFSGAYRQGAFSGSGIYTAWATQVLPLIIFLILITNGPTKSMAIPILVVVIACLVLGLRIYLWGIFVGFFLSIIKNLSLRNFFIGLSVVMIFFSYKYFLNPSDEISINYLIINQLTRPDLHAIVKYHPFSDNFTELLEYIPYVRFIFDHNISSFKEFYIPLIPNLNSLMPYISLYSGVALPGYVIFYNSLFVFAIIPISFILMALYYLIVMIKKTEKVIFKILFAYLFLVLSLALLEDANILYKLEEDMIFVLMSYIAYFCISRKNSLNFESFKSTST